MTTHAHAARSRIALIVGGALATMLAMSGCNDQPSGEAVDNTKSSLHGATMPTGGPDRLVLRLFHAQDLNEKQGAQLADLQRNLERQWRSMNVSIGAGAPALSAELTNSTPDAVRVHALADQSLATYRQMTHSAIDQALAFHATLSEKQRAALVARGVGSREDTKRDLQAILSFAHARAATTISPHDRAAYAVVPSFDPSSGIARPDTMVLRRFRDGALTPQQQAQLEAIRADLKHQRTAMHRVIRTNTPALLAELGKPTPDATKIHAIADQALALYETMTHSAVDKTLALQSTLSLEQRATLR